MMGFAYMDILLLVFFGKRPIFGQRVVYTNISVPQKWLSRCKRMPPYATSNYMSASIYVIRPRNIVFGLYAV